MSNGHSFIEGRSLGEEWDATHESSIATYENYLLQHPKSFIQHGETINTTS
jgi:hypothetical protein